MSTATWNYKRIHKFYFVMFLKTGNYISLKIRFLSVDKPNLFLLTESVFSLQIWQLRHRRSQWGHKGAMHPTQNVWNIQLFCALRGVFSPKIKRSHPKKILGLATPLNCGVPTISILSETIRNCAAV